MKKIIFYLTFFCFFKGVLFSIDFIDLEESPDEFIIETKQIIIPEYPDAFNASIVDLPDCLLMSFRIRDPLLKTTDQMGLIQLDQNFNPISKPFVIQFRNHLENERSMAQDPRLILVRNDLFMVYNDSLNSPYKSMRRMLIAKLEFDGQNYFVKNPEMITQYDHEIWNRHEKNWAPFVYHDKLLLTHSLIPHTIYEPIFGEGRSETIASTETLTDWDYGEPRGGTQAFIISDQYLSFFHSSKEMKTKQSNGKKITHYFMGAYTFQKDPPFSITQVSQKPIIGKNFYNGELHNTWKPLRCVFPCGYIFNEEFIYVTYGRQDHEIWVVKIDREKLLNSLIPIQNKR